jgi:hypothetical protein
MAPAGPTVDTAALVDQLAAAVSAMPPAAETYEQVVACALFAGFSEADAPTAAAIASAESSRNAIAVSGKSADGRRRYGLWQLPMTPEEAVSGLWIAPTNNATWALALRNSAAGGNSWFAYSSGVYAVNLAQAEAAARAVHLRLAPYGSPAARTSALQSIIDSDPATTAAVSAAFGDWVSGAALTPAVNAGGQAIGGVAGATGQALVDTLHPFASVLDFLNALGRASTWVRIAEAVIGGALVVVALRQVAVSKGITS